MKLEIELRDGFSPNDFENLKTTLTGFMVAMWDDKGFTETTVEKLSFNITAWKSENPMHSDNNKK